MMSEPMTRAEMLEHGLLSGDWIADAKLALHRGVMSNVAREAFRAVIEEAERLSLPVVGELPIASDLPVGDRTMIPHTYAAHAVMVDGPPGEPAIPAVMLDLEGVAAGISGRTMLRLLLELPVAEGIRSGISESRRMLDNLRRNQERPDGSTR